MKLSFNQELSNFTTTSDFLNRTFKKEELHL